MREVAALVLLAVLGGLWLWSRERRARSYPARRRAAFQARLRQADTPDELVAVAADWLAANLRHMPDRKLAWSVAKPLAADLTDAARELDKHVPKGAPK